MPYIQPEVVEKAKRMDLFTYLKNYEPQELVHFGGTTYTTRTHDSLKISNGKWCWFSRGIGGKTALDYLIKVQGLSFMEAVTQIVGQAAIQPPVFVSKPKEEKPKVLLLPKPSRCATHAVQYLERRGIDAELIEFCICTGRLYESVPYHNVVFVGFDKQENPRYANLRGIGTEYRGEANGSDKRYAFSIPAVNSTTLHLFESAIDLLSYATLQKMDGKDWRADHLLSLAGIYKPRKEVEKSTIPIALTQYLSDHPEIRQIVLRLDNDPVGRVATNTLYQILPEKYEVWPVPPPKGKDYNDCLCIKLNLPITKKIERTNER